MAQREIKYGQAFATYLTADGAGTGTQTLATTSAIPKNAVVTGVTMISRAVTDSASDNATFVVVAGGVNCNAAFTEANLIAAGYVARQNVVAATASISDGTDIKVTIAGSTVAAGCILDIIVEYILVD